MDTEMGMEMDMDTEDMVDNAMHSTSTGNAQGTRKITAALNCRQEMQH